MKLTEAEIKPLRGYGFLTLKPMLIVLNTDEKNPNPTIGYEHQHSRCSAFRARSKPSWRSPTPTTRRCSWKNRHHRTGRGEGYPAVLRTDGDPVLLHRWRG
ncbi:MAG: hypothetical protein M5U34_05095 [Chloroflexi bacterium]|nr:hypothetical protein [Chloroflexota bacterium]